MQRNLQFFLSSHLSQALAAIGQGRLIALWDNLFGQLEQPIAQILLTRGDISDVRLTVLSFAEADFMI